jgi:hypothetical protein
MDASTSIIIVSDGDKRRWLWKNDVGNLSMPAQRASSGTKTRIPIEYLLRVR